jgi:RNA polymerase sigma factor (TIGR02999 family)
LPLVSVGAFRIVPRVSDATLIMARIGRGDAGAAEELLPLVYDELRRLAAAKLAREPEGQTLQPTALVHEAWLRLGGERQPDWESRRHFFGAAAEAMRRILIDRARRRLAVRHGGDWERVHPDELDAAAEGAPDHLVALDEALAKLAAIDPPKAELVKLRYFVGLTTDEAAEILGVSVTTANRWWDFTRAWLHAEIKT